MKGKTKSKPKTKARSQNRKPAKQPSLISRLQKAWRPKWQPQWPNVPREATGVALIILSALTLLGLSNLSSGALLDWWATAWLRLFGWWAYPVILAVAVLGLWLIWDDFRRRVPLHPQHVVGIELLLVSLLTASHAPLVLRLGSEEAWISAHQGQGGGYIGWAFALLQVEALGALVGSLVLLIVFLGALFLLLSLSPKDLTGWLQIQGRALAALWGRWTASTKGTAVLPETEEIPWWEEESEPAQRPKKKKSARKPRRTKDAVQQRAGNLPPLDLLDPASPKTYGDTDVRRKTQIIEDTLESFGVPAKVVMVNQGPTVTQFGLDPGYIERKGSNGQVQRQRVRVAKISGLSNDLALALAAAPIRIEAPVPGQSVVGLEVPNEQISLVSLSSVLESEAFQGIESPLAIALGEDVSGQPVAVDLKLMPHLLIAGSTGSGKSVCINTIVCSLLLNNTPEDLRLLMIDPKMVELVGYNGIPHLLAPVVVEVDHVVTALSWITRQMDERYQMFHQVGVRNLDEYNHKMSRRKDGETLPHLVVFIDELADMMMMAPDEVERHICRLAQMGRATGIHLVIATQRPSVDVVTGLIKANFPARISFAVTSLIDSRVILDQPGAENLLGRGDMLFMVPSQAGAIRLQGCFVSDREIERLTSFWRNQRAESDPEPEAAPWSDMDMDEPPDSLLDQAIGLLRGRDRVSTSFIQRQMRIGFPRAARLMDQLEEKGVVGPDEGGGRGREVWVDRGIDWDEIDERLPGVEPR